MNEIELQDAKIQLTRWINEYRDHILEDCFIYDGHRWDCDKQARSNLMGVVTFVNVGGTLPPDFVWRDYDNNFVPMSSAQLLEMFFSAAAFTTACYQASWTHKATMNGLTLTEDVLSYDYTNSLWPVTTL